MTSATDPVRTQSRATAGKRNMRRPTLFDDDLNPANGDPVNYGAGPGRAISRRKSGPPDGCPTTHRAGHAGL